MIDQGMMISDRYEVVDKVGSGGMADVYKAKDHRLNRFVAIKILKQEYSNDAKFVSKFRGEAQSVAGLSHPNVVNVYDVGEDDNLHYIVMELVEGITLKKYIEVKKEQKTKLNINDAVDIAIQIARGMEEAHNNHVIHRDIKPQNIIISKDGNVKVTDFGIAKAATSNTITSNAMGSVHYISPEQARGGHSDERSDIYSLGVTMYEMFSGSVPFEGESTVTIALAHIRNEAVTLEERDREIPRSLSRIVQKCMQKKPEMRYLKASDLISDLERALSEPDGEYVKLEPLMVDSSPTIKISDQEMNAIREASRIVEPVDEEEYFEEEEPMDDNAIDPKLERILKICSAVVAVILVVGVILIVGKFAGWWGGGQNEVTSEATASPGATAGAEGQVPVPGIVGRTLEEAEQLLKDSKLQWQLQPVESEEEPNIVTDQDPAEGEMVDEYSRVTIYYSKEDDGITVPDVVNQTESSARTAIEGAGLVVGSVTEVYSNTVESGRVVETDPVVGSSVDEGTTVNITISKGAEGDMVPVPNIVGKKESVALERLSAVGLQGDSSHVTYVHSDKYKYGVVVSQSEKSGQSVAKGTVITYSVSLGPEETQAPATAEPTEAPSYSYEGSVTISNNPFSSPDEEPATIKLVLSQDGSSQTVWKGTLSYDDFPKEFPVKGWSENTGSVTLCKNDQEIAGTYSVDFKKVAK